MNVVVVGGGKVGQLLTQLLVEEGHDVVVIDNRESVLEELQESFDVAIVHGNGATVDIQREANVGETDLMIAATSSDEVNLLCCVVANMLGANHTVARVRNPEYDGQIDFLGKKLGLDMALNPEKETAREIFRILQFPNFTKRDTFAAGRVELVEFKLTKENPLVGKKLYEAKELAKVNALICAVDRDGQVFIPSGSFVLEENDIISVAAEGSKLVNLLHTLKMVRKPIKNVMIIGGSSIGEYLAERLLKTGVDVTIIDSDKYKCKDLSARLPKANVIRGNGTQQDLLLAEGLRDMDAVITLTGMDEENMIISMFANSIGIPKTVTKINRTEYLGVLKNAGIDTTVSPKLLVANEIMRYVRAIYEKGTVTESDTAGTIETLYRLFNGKAEAIGFTVPKEGNFQGVSLKQLHLKPHILVANIVRGNQVIIPKGDDCMLPGDSIVIVTTSDQAISNLTDIFAPGSLY